MTRNLCVCVCVSTVFTGDELVQVFMGLFQVTSYSTVCAYVPLSFPTVDLL